MPRIKRAIDYIEALCSSKNKGKSSLGEKLKQHYNTWSKTLNMQDFLCFLDIIKENKDMIGVPQFFGKFRAYAFEEYLYRLIKTRVNIPKNLQTFWGERCIVWHEGKSEYTMEFDVSIGKKVNNFVKPKMVFEAKIELDASRLKTAVASFVILKQWNPCAKCVLVYLIRDFDTTVVRLAERWVDGIFQFGTKNSELIDFVDFVNKSLSKF